MANKTLFASLRDALIPQTDTVNSENAPTYTLAPKLLAAIWERRELSDGFALRIDGKRIGLAEIGEWISMERLCCPFLNFHLSVAGTDGPWMLTLTGPAGAQAVIREEFPMQHAGK